ncbi:MAG: hypothetical protein IJC29_03250 [Clostridia bacterium]|nr:hypothetical protein [Clostridia bacterium]
MGKKLSITAPSDAMTCGVTEGIVKGMEIFCPEHFFGVAFFKYKYVAAFDKSIKISKKNFPNARFSLFSGKEKDGDIRVYFFPYGLKSSFEVTGREFAMENGKRATVTMSVKYEIEIEDPAKLGKFNSELGCWNPNKDGSVQRHQYMRTDLTRLLVEKRDDALAKQQGSDWTDPSDARRGKPRYIVVQELRQRVLLESIFEDYGYKVTSCDVKISDLRLL